MRLHALLGLIAGVTACASEIQCPDGREARGSACVCAGATIDVDASCVAAPAVDAGGAGDGGIAMPPSDEGGGRDEDGDVTGEREDGRDPSAPRDLDAATPPPPRPSGSCGNGIEEADEQCDDGNDSPYDLCVRCQDARCGDGFIQAANGEDCEDGAVTPGLAQTSPLAWNASTCSFATCTRKLYNVCTTHAECPGGARCVSGICAPLHACPKATLADQLVGRSPHCGECPGLPPSYVTLAEDDHCVIQCLPTRPEMCPVGLACRRHDLTVNGLDLYLCRNPSFVPFAR
ncbi:MAG: DUF4215 domain-containing protein [Polyangiales bacterium]